MDRVGGGACEAKKWLIRKKCVNYDWEESNLKSGLIMFMWLSSKKIHSSICVVRQD